jgi:hypothetical protein
MFITKDLVFLELHKTGCTQIYYILDHVFDGKMIGKHNQASPDLFEEEKVFIGSIRDPWEWYTSLWAYGCDQRGAVYHKVTREKKSIRGLGWRRNPYKAFLKLFHSRDPQKWKDTYSDVDDAEAFREWLYMMHDPKYQPDIEEGYSDSAVSQNAGLLTFRYLYLFCTKDGEWNNLNKLSTLDEISNYENEQCFIDYFIRNENLEKDIFRCIKEIDEELPDHTKKKILTTRRINASSKKYGPEYYYDAATEELVAEREQLIIDKFRYTAPSEN